MTELYLYDTTLRDGTQGENISFSADEKIKVAKRLDEFGIHYIEGGWPGSNPRDMQFFDLARRTEFKHARIAAFSATRKPGIHPEKDANVQALLASGAPVVTVFGKTWDLHVEKVMENTLEENLNMIGDTVAFLKEKGLEVVYDAEHFFDGFNANPEYAVKSLDAARQAGADFLVLCDTNGGTLHNDIEDVLKQMLVEFTKGGNDSPKFGIHAHNDCGLAVANSLSAIRSGAVMVHGTINGYGERCGNADLITVIPALWAKMDIKCVTGEQLSQIKNLSRFVSETANMTPLNARPFVGRSRKANDPNMAQFHNPFVRLAACSIDLFKCKSGFW
jgi:2-isopropylmalate synthase